MQKAISTANQDPKREKMIKKVEVKNLVSGSGNVKLLEEKHSF